MPFLLGESFGISSNISHISTILSLSNLKIWNFPSAIFKITRGVFFGTTRSPHYAIEGYKGEDDNFSHVYFCSPEEIFTIQWIPNLSVSMPKVSPQNCFASSISTFPPSDNLLNHSVSCVSSSPTRLI